MTVRILRGDALREATYPAGEHGDYARRFLSALAVDGPRRFVANVRCELGVALSEANALPFTVTDGRARDNAYVVSPFTHYVSYLDEELRLVRSLPARALLSRVLAGLGMALRAGSIDRVVTVNNWLLSTNLYPELAASELRAFTQQLRAAFPDHALMFRSLNTVTTPTLMAELAALGFTPLLSRRVYLFDARDPALFRRKAFRRDHALIARFGYRVEQRSALDDAQAARIVALYRALYLDKYSRHNPAFTAEFVLLAVRERLLEVHTLEKHGRIDGVIGFFTRAGVMTTPLLGYDTALPQHTGLYRMLTASLGQLARERGLLLHRSSGAATFKRARGATATLEYSMVDARHLSVQRRASWRCLRLLANHVGKPLLERYDR